jgi:hypothetical protein
MSVLASVVDIEPSTQNSSQGSEGDDHCAGKLQTDSQPTVGREVEEVGLLVPVQKEVALVSESLFVTVGSDSCQAIECLREEGVDGTAADGVETSQLAGGLDEILLGFVIEEGDGADRKE